MTLAPILTGSDEIAGLAETLAKETAIAVDLEADSMHNYREKICLMQFSSPRETWLVDPLAGADLEPLGTLLADPSRRKIFHAADYDLRCLRRDFGWQVHGLFDTMISCQFIGEEKFGLADVLLKYFDVELDKQFQRADWSQRPLSEGMIRYAAADTAYLHRLAEQLEARLLELGRREWLTEEFQLQEQVAFQENSGPLCVRIKGAGGLSRRQLGILEQLLQWREREAERRDQPPFKIMGNKTFLALAQNVPENLQELGAIEGLTPRVVDRYGKLLLKQIESGQTLSDSSLPVFPRGERRRRDPEAETRLKTLKAWRSEAAADYGIEPGVLINNAQLETLAHTSPDKIVELPGLKNWQRQEFGDALLGLLAVTM